MAPSSEKQDLLFEDSAPREFTPRQRAMFGAIQRMWFPDGNLKNVKLKRKIGEQADMLAALGLTPHTFPVAIANYQAKFGPCKERPQGLACNARAIANNWEDVQPTPKQLVEVQVDAWARMLTRRQVNVPAHMQRYVVLVAWGETLPARLLPAARELWFAFCKGRSRVERDMFTREIEWLRRCPVPELVI